MTRMLRRRRAVDDLERRGAGDGGREDVDRLPRAASAAPGRGDALRPPTRGWNRAMREDPRALPRPWPSTLLPLRHGAAPGGV